MGYATLNLSIEYFDQPFLERLGSKIGRIVKVDKTTSLAERGKYARLCIEVDLRKPLLSKYRLRRHIRRIEYEGIDLI